MAWWFFALTLLLEAPIVWLGYRGRWKTAVLPFLLLNLFTWPLLHYLLLTTAFDINWLEAGVALAEGAGYYWLVQQKLAKALLIAVLANGFSYGMGLIITYYFF